MQPSVKVPGPREALIVPRDSSWPLLQRQAREKELETAHETHKLLCRPAVVFAVTVLRERSATLQLLQESQSTDKPAAQGVKFAENGRRYFLSFFFFSLFFPEIKTIS